MIFLLCALKLINICGQLCPFHVFIDTFSLSRKSSLKQPEVWKEFKMKHQYFDKNINFPFCQKNIVISQYWV